METLDIKELSGAGFIGSLYLITGARKYRDGYVPIEPAFRKIEGLEPDIQKYQVTQDRDGRIDWDGVKRKAESTPEPLGIILRDRSEKLLEVLYLPGAKYPSQPHIKDITEEAAILRGIAERFKDCAEDCW